MSAQDHSFCSRFLTMVGEASGGSDTVGSAYWLGNTKDETTWVMFVMVWHSLVLMPWNLLCVLHCAIARILQKPSKKGFGVNFLDDQQIVKRTHVGVF